MALRFRLWHRLFLALALLSVAALAGFAAWQQLAFERGFLAYLDESTLARLAPAATRLADAYAERGDWSALRGEPLDVKPLTGISAYEPTERAGCYVIGGHIHPGVVLNGQGRQRLRLPCFAFGPRVGLLPAFGTNTGTFIIQPATTHRVFAVTDGAVLDVSAAFTGQQPTRRTK